MSLSKRSPKSFRHAGCSGICVAASMDYGRSFFLRSGKGGDVSTDGCSGCGMTGGGACWEMRRGKKLVRCGVVVNVQSGFPARG